MAADDWAGSPPQKQLVVREKAGQWKKDPEEATGDINSV